MYSICSKPSRTLTKSSALHLLAWILEISRSRSGSLVSDDMNRSMTVRSALRASTASSRALIRAGSTKGWQSHCLSILFPNGVTQWLSMEKRVPSVPPSKELAKISRLIRLWPSRTSVDPRLMGSYHVTFPRVINSRSIFNVLR